MTQAQVTGLDQSRGGVRAPRPAREVGQPAYCSKCRVLINVHHPQVSQLSLPAGSHSVPPLLFLEQGDQQSYKTSAFNHSAPKGLGHIIACRAFWPPSAFPFSTAPTPTPHKCRLLRRQCNWNLPLQQLPHCSHPWPAKVHLYSVRPELAAVGGPEEVGLSVGGPKGKKFCFKGCRTPGCGLLEPSTMPPDSKARLECF